MSIITLTDRISVSVRAKNETERSSQSKATGANIQKALGGSGLSDADLEEIGNVNSITDEDGNEWIKMSDIIAAGRKMKEKGAFGEKKSYSYGNVACVQIPIDPNDSNGRNIDKSTGLFYGYADGRKKFNPPTAMYGPVGLNADGYPVYLSAVNHSDISKPVYAGWIHNVNDDSYRLIWNNGGDRSTIGETDHSNFVVPDNPDPDGEGTDWPRLVGWGGTSLASYSPISIIPCTDVGQTLSSLSAYGDLHEETSGGSLIDWDAPNAEVERQIKNLHETWDVTEHPGASGQGIGAGTYILAGPIEFNDGD